MNQGAFLQNNNSNSTWARKYVMVQEGKLPSEGKT